MKQLQVRVGIVVVWLLLLPFLDGADLPPGFDLSPLFYIGTAAIVVVSLLLQLGMRRLLVLGIVVILLYAFGPLQDDARGSQLAVVLEMISLEVTLMLVFVASKSIHDSERLFQYLVLREGYTRLTSYADFVARMQSEIGRARRHQRNLSLAVISLSSEQRDALVRQTAHQIQEQLVKHAAADYFGLILGRHIRETDVITQHPKTGQFLLLSPETSADEATQLAGRLAHTANAELGGQLRYKVSSFPEHSLTAEGLLEMANTRLYRTAYDVEPETFAAERLTPSPVVEAVVGHAMVSETATTEKRS
ncbi:MAG: hypothetical protein RLZZ387_4626 [Chloroflexota bacterium]|jgi:GGDEF domain-containing protein